MASWDTTQLAQLAQSFTDAGERTEAVRVGVQNALEQAKSRAREAYTAHPDKGFQAVGSTFSYETRGSGGVVEAEFGPSKPRGALANITIWGTSRGGGGMPHPAEFMDQHVLDEIGDTLDEILRSLT